MKNLKIKVDVQTAATKRLEKADTVDTVTMDIPLLTRIMEVCREEVKSDVELHELLTNLITVSKDKPVLNIEDYATVWTKKSTD